MTSKISYLRNVELAFGVFIKWLEKQKSIKINLGNMSDRVAMSITKELSEKELPQDDIGYQKQIMSELATRRRYRKGRSEYRLLPEDVEAVKEFITASLNILIKREKKTWEEFIPRLDCEKYAENLEILSKLCTLRNHQITNDLNLLSDREEQVIEMEKALGIKILPKKLLDDLHDKMQMKENSGLTDTLADIETDESSDWENKFSSTGVSDIKNNYDEPEEDRQTQTKKDFERMSKWVENCQAKVRKMEEVIERYRKNISDREEEVRRRHHEYFLRAIAFDKAQWKTAKVRLENIEPTIKEYKIELQSGKRRPRSSSPRRSRSPPRKLRKSEVGKGKKRKY